MEINLFKKYQTKKTAMIEEYKLKNYKLKKIKLNDKIQKIKVIIFTQLQ